MGQLVRLPYGRLNRSVNWEKPDRPFKHPKLLARNDFHRLLHVWLARGRPRPLQSTEPTVVCHHRFLKTKGFGNPFSLPARLLP